MTTTQIIETLLKTNFIDANKFESIEDNFVSCFIDKYHVIITMQGNFVLIDKTTNNTNIVHNGYNFEFIDIIAEIQKYIKPFPYKKGDTFSTKEYGILNNITTKKAYILLTNFEKNDVLCKYGYKTKFGWEDIDESNLKTNSIHWQVCN